MQNPEAHWPASLAYFVSAKLVRGPISKEIKADSALGTAAEVILGSHMQEHT